MKTASTFATVTTALLMVWSAQAAAEGIYDSIAETSTVPVPRTTQFRGPDFGVAELDDAVNDYQTQPGWVHDMSRIPTVTQTTGFGVDVLDEGIHDYSTGS